MLVRQELRKLVGAVLCHHVDDAVAVQEVVDPAWGGREADGKYFDAQRQLVG